MSNYYMFVALAKRYGWGATVEEVRTKCGVSIYNSDGSLKLWKDGLKEMYATLA